MEEIVPGVYRMVLPLKTDNSLFSSKATVNSYLLRGRDGCMLIDLGWNTREVLAALNMHFEELGLGWNDITRIVFTHLHPDHYGIAGRIREFCPAPHAAHREDVRFYGKEYSRTAEEITQDESRLLKRNGVPVEYWKGQIDFTLESLHLVRFLMPETLPEDGDVIDFPPFRLRVIWTPGHAPGQVCLYEPGLKLLFIGDHIVETNIPPIAFLPNYAEDFNPMALYTNSLRSLETGLDGAQVLPAHGRPFSDLKSHIRRIISTLEQRDARLIEVLGDQELNSFEVAKLVNRGKSWEDMQIIERRWLMVDTLSRLHSLYLSGRMERVFHDDVVSYRRSSV